MVHDAFLQIAQYVPSCEIVAYSLGILPFFGSIQDLALIGNQNSEVASYPGMVYLHEVSAVAIFVVYKVSQGAHYPKFLCFRENCENKEVIRWQSWLQEVLNPFCMVHSLRSQMANDT